MSGLRTRKLGRSGLEVSALGMGCWAIGGPNYRDGNPIGWGPVDDEESLRAIRRALELGITFFDTADIYGCGHSEVILGKALGRDRERVTLATKFGLLFEEGQGPASGKDASPAYIRRACEASLRRLQTDRLDLYQFHIWDHPAERAGEVLATLEQLVQEGKIRWYGWSCDEPGQAAAFAAGAHCAAIQQQLNLFEGSLETLSLCEKHKLASVNRGPLARGLLTGKFNPDSKLPPDDIRHRWDFKSGSIAQRLARLEQLRATLTRDGRTLAQAALGWLWAKSHHTIPIPGFKTVAQAEENIGALKFGPLSKEQMAEVERLSEPPRLPVPPARP
jgi:aryl-alcohol dehydrogenase-like predicted oxidoreductase